MLCPPCQSMYDRPFNDSIKTSILAPKQGEKIKGRQLTRSSEGLKSGITRRRSFLQENDHPEPRVPRLRNHHPVKEGELSPIPRTERRNSTQTVLGPKNVDQHPVAKARPISTSSSANGELPTLTHGPSHVDSSAMVHLFTNNVTVRELR